MANSAPAFMQILILAYVPLWLSQEWWSRLTIVIESKIAKTVEAERDLW